MTKTVLKLDNINFRYKTTDNFRLKNLNFKLKEGEFVTIIGSSGSGKSTLFRLITGLEQPETGNIVINGEWSTERLGSIGYMPQTDLLMPWRTILQNASLPLELQGYKKVEAEKEVKKLLNQFGLAGCEHKYPKELSGGMKQRVSFLRTILSGADVLLLDEPFSALDAITKLSMQEWLLKQWSMWKKSIVFITHDVNEALFLSDRILIFENAQNEQQMRDIKVPIGRPRDLRDLNKTTMIRLKEYLMDELRK